MDKHIIQPVSHQLFIIVFAEERALPIHFHCQGFASESGDSNQHLSNIMPNSTQTSSVCLEFTLPAGQSQSHLRLIKTVEKYHDLASGQQAVKHHPLLQRWWTLRTISVFQPFKIINIYIYYIRAIHPPKRACLRNVNVYVLLSQADICIQFYILWKSMSRLSKHWQKIKQTCCVLWWITQLK